METKSKTTRARKTTAKTPRAVSQTRPRASFDAAKPSSPTHEQIALRAHELYVRSGYQQGREQEFWLEAERQLRSESGRMRV